MTEALRQPHPEVVKRIARHLLGEDIINVRAAPVTIAADRCWRHAALARLRDAVPA